MIIFLFLLLAILNQTHRFDCCMQVRPPNVAVMRPRGMTSDPGTLVASSRQVNIPATKDGATLVGASRADILENIATTETSAITEPLENSTAVTAEPVGQVSTAQECKQPPETSSLFVSDTVNQYDDVSFGPLGGPDSAPYEKRCGCGNGTMYYYKSVNTTSWFNILARAQQAVDLNCALMEPMCVCDTMDICYTGTNSTVHAVLASYCEKQGECNLYMLVEGDTDEEGIVPIDGGAIIKTSDQYAPDSTTPYMINSPLYNYKKISAIACGHCPIYRPEC